jgi:hypothetical protein
VGAYEQGEDEGDNGGHEVAGDEYGPAGKAVGECAADRREHSKRKKPPRRHHDDPQSAPRM